MILLLFGLAWASPLSEPIELPYAPVTAPVPAAPPVEVEPAPAQGLPSQVTVRRGSGQPAPGETVQVAYRPGLAGERVVAIGITDDQGRVTWTPDAPGVAHLLAGDERLGLTVTREALPLPTLGLLGSLLLGAGLALALGAPRRGS